MFLLARNTLFYRIAKASPSAGLTSSWGLRYERGELNTELEFVNEKARRKAGSLVTNEQFWLVLGMRAACPKFALFFLLSGTGFGFRAVDENRIGFLDDNLFRDDYLFEILLRRHVVHDV